MARTRPKQEPSQGDTRYVRAAPGSGRLRQPSGEYARRNDGARSSCHCTTSCVVGRTWANRRIWAPWVREAGLIRRVLRSHVADTQVAKDIWERDQSDNDHGKDHDRCQNYCDVAHDVHGVLILLSAVARPDSVEATTRSERLGWEWWGMMGVDNDDLGRSPRNPPWPPPSPGRNTRCRPREKPRCLPWSALLANY